MILKTYNIDQKSETKIYTSVDCDYYRFLDNNRRIVIVSDENLYNLYPKIFEGKNFVLIPIGEENKNLITVSFIIEKFIEFGLDRRGLVIGFGGGMVCDIAAFAANLFMRGTRFGLIPTTLLAQVDAAIGGKNGVNFNNYKNYIGNIAQPEFVICDAQVLDTLSEIDYLSGLGEIFKYSLIADLNLFNQIAECKCSLLNREATFLNKIIQKCIDFKVGIICQDPQDLGLRHILNFGHSFGHAFEILDKLPHGIAVVKGISVALDLSVKSNYLDIATSEQIKNVLIDFGYDLNYTLNSKHFDLLANDKKKCDDIINFVFLKNIGEPIVEKVKIQDLIDSLS
jgi:3-dehydroquinate synthase